MKDPGPGYLLLEDGTRFDGESYLGEVALGEAVFNTSHSGYQEVLSDPSYRRQLVLFTAPHIGNVGVNPDDLESDRVQAAGAVVRSLAPRARSWRSRGDLADWLGAGGCGLLVGADTRAVTLHLRGRGAMRAGLFPITVPADQALEQVRSSPEMSGADLVREVSCTEPYRAEPRTLLSRWHEDCGAGVPPAGRGQAPANHDGLDRLDWSLWHPLDNSGRGLRVAVLDCGVKHGILRELLRRGCEVTVLPASATAEELLATGCHGVLVSNGPGDPAALPHLVATVRRLLDAGLPFFGICLGHQLLALAAGGTTFKLPFGHRGANHPVRRSDGTVEITSQNHGFAVRPEGLGSGWRQTHVNLNDGTLEGLEHVELPVFSIQYHPEASPGPHEGRRYFDRFIEEMRRAAR